MADVSAFKTLATDLLTANGQTIQIRRVTDGAVGSTPWKPGAPTTADEAVFSAVFQIKDEKIDGTLVQRGDRLALISAADVSGGVPNTSDLLVIGGNAHKIINVETISPSNDDVLYKVQVRQ